MKKLILLCSIAILSSCEHKPEFYMNGKPYYTRERCVESNLVTTFGYHYGLNIMTGKYEYHIGSYTENVCIKTKVDTIQIK